MPFLNVGDGVSLRYEDSGEGRPLVFIHGWCMSSTVWSHLIGELAGAFRLVTLDLRGHGRSTGGNLLALPALADDLMHLLEAFDLQGAVLVGWSLGAQVALQAVARNPGRIGGMILVGGTPRFSAGDDWAYGLPPDEVRGMALRVRRQYLKTMEEFFRRMFAEGELSPDEYRRIAHDVAGGGENLPAPETALRGLDLLAGADLRDEAKRVPVPVLLVHGDADTICLPGASRWMAANFPEASLELLPDTGHAPFLSRPEIFRRLLEKFVCTLP